MIKCHNCGKESAAGSRFCDECGTMLAAAPESVEAVPSAPLYRPPMTTDAPPARAVSVTSIGIPPVHPEIQSVEPLPPSTPSGSYGTMNAKLVIERGDSPGVEFKITGTEAVIGRWDADNGVFPDVDLDVHDGEAKVSRRHARIKFVDGKYLIEDLGSTNGTYVNRGRRLLPGNAQALVDGDEVIVGKTFMRFHIIG